MVQLRENRCNVSPKIVLFSSRVDYGISGATGQESNPIDDWATSSSLAGTFGLRAVSTRLDPEPKSHPAPGSLLINSANESSAREQVGRLEFGQCKDDAVF